MVKANLVMEHDVVVDIVGLLVSDGRMHCARGRRCNRSMLAGRGMMLPSAGSKRRRLHRITCSNTK